MARTQNGELTTVERPSAFPRGSARRPAGAFKMGVHLTTRAGLGEIPSRRHYKCILVIASAPHRRPAGTAGMPAPRRRAARMQIAGSRR